MDSRYRDIVNADPNLLGYWKLENDYVDSKAGNNGSSISGTFDTCVIGRGADFNNTSGELINITHSSSYQFIGTQDFSAELFFEPRTNKAQIFLDHRCAAESGFVFYMIAPTQGLAARVGGYFNDSALGTITSGPHHLVFSVDRDVGITAYVDGVGTTVAISTNIYNIAVSSYLTFGGRSWSPEAMINLADGCIDEVSLYSRALTAADVRARYDAFIAKDRPWLSTGLNGRGG